MSGHRKQRISCSKETTLNYTNRIKQMVWYEYAGWLKRDVFRTLSDVYDRAFLQKLLTTKIC